MYMIDLSGAAGACSQQGSEMTSFSRICGFCAYMYLKIPFAFAARHSLTLSYVLTRLYWQGQNPSY